MIKQTIQKIILAAFWLAIGSGISVLLVAAIGRKNRETCKDYTIRIKGKQENFFIDQKDIMQLVVAATKGKLKEQRIASINLQGIEEYLENDPWIEDAQLYFDNRDILHITVREREPVARIFTTAGNSFYIDKSAIRIPLSNKLSARVPVFTNFPEKKVLTAKDSSLLTDVKNTAEFILNDPFWMVQTSQIDIVQQHNFEMIPTFGNHLVRLGNGENIEKKFHRLFIFYTQVLTKTGFDKYSLLDVEYAGQVIGTRRGTTSIADTAQLRLNIEKLLAQARQIQVDTAVIASPKAVMGKREEQ
jgi:cell division protein FtsQ